MSHVAWHCVCTSIYRKVKHSSHFFGGGGWRVGTRDLRRPDGVTRNTHISLYLQRNMFKLVLGLCHHMAGIFGACMRVGLVWSYWPIYNYISHTHTRAAASPNVPSQSIISPMFQHGKTHKCISVFVFVRHQVHLLRVWTPKLCVQTKLVFRRGNVEWKRDDHARSVCSRDRCDRLACKFSTRIQC